MRKVTFFNMKSFFHSSPVLKSKKIKILDFSMNPVKQLTGANMFTYTHREGYDCLFMCFVFGAICIIIATLDPWTRFQVRSFAFFRFAHSNLCLVLSFTKKLRPKTFSTVCVKLCGLNKNFTAHTLEGLYSLLKFLIVSLSH